MAKRLKYGFMNIVYNLIVCFVVSGIVLGAISFVMWEPPPYVLIRAAIAIPSVTGLFVGIILWVEEK